MMGAVKVEWEEGLRQMSVEGGAVRVKAGVGRVSGEGGCGGR